jgi:hypothetical protein
MVAIANSDRRKDRTMPIIENTAVIPNVSADFHLLEIEDVEPSEGTKYGEPDVPETRIKMTLRVRTPGESDESFTAWMSPKLGEKATLGGIVRAVLGAAPADPTFDTDVLIGRVFRQMVSHNDRGWPTLVPGTAAPAKRAPGEPEPPF